MAMPWVRDFQRKLKFEWTIKPKCFEHQKNYSCFCTEHIVRTKPLKAWLSSRTNDNAATNGKQLLNELNKTWGLISDSLTGLESILAEDDPKQSVLVLSCLILINPEHGHLVQYFCDANITDQTLTNENAQGNKKLIRKLEHLRDDERKDLLQQFDKHKWSFCPIMIDDELLQGQTFRNDRKNIRFPFKERGSIRGQGGQAKVRSVLVHEDFIENPDLLSEEEPRVERKGQIYYNLAVKTYPARYEEEFEAERDAFKGLAKSSGVIRYFGAFTHLSGQSEDEVCHYLILELADYNLYEFFERQNPPVLSEEIIDTWKTILEGAEALRSVHEVEYDSRTLNGWHGDVKPENFLFVRNKLKLTDFGFFAVTDPKILEKRLRGATKTYAPPDKDGNKRQTFDTWSFGCVLSIAATWITVGTTGVDNYERHRQKAHKQAFPDQDIQLDQFHDGNDVYKSIHGWHEALRTEMRPSDFVTLKILELVDQHLLISDPKLRYGSKSLCHALNAIISEAENFVQKPTDLALYQWATPKLLEHFRQLIQSDPQNAFNASNWSDQMAQFKPAPQQLFNAIEAHKDVQTSLWMSEEYRIARKQGHEGPVEITVDGPPEDGEGMKSMTMKLDATVIGSKRVGSGALDPNRTTSRRADALSKTVKQSVRVKSSNELQPVAQEPTAPLNHRDSFRQSRSQRLSNDESQRRKGKFRVSDPSDMGEPSNPLRIYAPSLNSGSNQSLVHIVTSDEPQVYRKPLQNDNGVPPHASPRTPPGAPRFQNLTYLQSLTSGSGSERSISYASPPGSWSPGSRLVGEHPRHSQESYTRSPPQRSPAQSAQSHRPSISSDRSHVPSTAPERARGPSFSTACTGSTVSTSGNIFDLVKNDTVKANRQLRKLLESQGMELAARTDNAQRTPIMIAARELLLEKVIDLIEYSDLSAKDNDGMTVVHHLVCSKVHNTSVPTSLDEDKFVEVLELLLEPEKPENISSLIDNRGYPALHYACMSKDESILSTVQTLVEASSRNRGRDDSTVRENVLRLAVANVELEVLRALENYIVLIDWQIIRDHEIPKGEKGAYVRDKLYPKSGKNSKHWWSPKPKKPS